MKNIETREIMINKNGKPLFAVRIDSGNERGDANYVFVQNGEVRFDSSWLNSIVPYSLSNESHVLAKEIFTIGLQAAVKTKIYELKQLEAILKDLNLSECLGNVMVDNTKLLLQVNENLTNVKNEIVEANETNLREITSKVVSREDVLEATTEAIENTVKPIVRKKRKTE